MAAILEIGVWAASSNVRMYRGKAKMLIGGLERVSIECRKTKTKVITLANQKGRRQFSKPVKTRSNLHAAGTKRVKMCTREPRLVLVSLLIG